MKPGGITHLWFKNKKKKKKKNEHELSFRADNSVSKFLTATDASERILGNGFFSAFVKHNIQRLTKSLINIQIISKGKFWAMNLYERYFITWVGLVSSFKCARTINGLIIKYDAIPFKFLYHEFHKHMDLSWQQTVSCPYVSFRHNISWT